jgi:integrase/recombinase XerC
VLFAQYLAFLADQRRASPHTLRAYQHTLDEFAAFLAGHLGEALTPPALAGLQPADFRAFLSRRRGQGLANVSLAREASALRGFFNWARQHDILRCDGIAGLKAPRLPRRVPRPVAAADAHELIDRVEANASQPWVAARDTAVLLLLWGAGLRISEALALDGDALPLGPVLTVTGKRNKQRQVPVLPAVADAIALYVAACPFPVQRGEPLFRALRGGRLDAGAVRTAMRQARVAMGLPDSATPHALRHSFATDRTSVV